MKEFVIEKGIPTPNRYSHVGGLSLVLRKMVVGDSVLVPDRSNASISASGRIIGNEIAAKFITRKVEGGVRIWRVS